MGGDGSSGAQTKHKFPWNNQLSHAKCEPPPPADGMPLTQDHKPILATERQRIEKAGGQVSNGRVNGMIEVARSFGDMQFKKFGVVALCDVRVRFKLTEVEEFVLLGCDGLWGRCVGHYHPHQHLRRYPSAIAKRPSPASSPLQRPSIIP